MKRRDLLGGMAAGLLPLSGAPRAAALPNVVYILADDLGWGDLDCYNPRSAVPTPNSRKLAAQGVRFTDMHSPSSVCTPTRYGILSGRYCWRSRLKQGVLNGYSPSLLEPGRLTVPSLFRSRGYYTAGVGKWHLGLGDAPKTDFTQPLRPGPLQHGFDYYYGIPASLDMPPYLYFENDRPVEPPSSSTPGANRPRGVFWREGPMSPRFSIEGVLPHLTEKATGILRERARQPRQPFFLYFPLTAPHTPWVPQPAFQGRSQAGLYGDFVAQVDHTLGQVMQTLEETGLSQNTLLILTSDNGADWKVEDKSAFAHRANADWRGEKADIWEGGHRVPFLARWPGKTRPGSTSGQLGCLTDLMATAADITGTPLPPGAGEDSYSLLPALLGTQAKASREAIVHHSIDGMFSIRQGEWKLELGLGSGGFSAPKRIVPQPGDPQGQLYNIAADPAETTNLWLRHPEIVARLTGLLDRYVKEGRSRPL